MQAVAAFMAAVVAMAAVAAVVAMAAVAAEGIGND
jgi:hypothetical protein